jgi:hypothetical protein
VPAEASDKSRIHARAVARVGTRRLYDALGFDAQASGEILIEQELGADCTATVYLGPKPPRGIAALTEASQFLVPAQQVSMGSMSSDYQAPFFLDIAISRTKVLSSGELAALRAQDPKTQSSLMTQSADEQAVANELLDWFAGCLALKVHRQLVLKLLIQNEFIEGDFEPAMSYFGSAVEILEPVSMNSQAPTLLPPFMQRICSAPEYKIREGGAVFHWLLRAWRERDPVSKFMYLFIPLESVLQSDEGLSSEATADIDRLIQVVRAAEIADQDELLGFLVRARARFSPTLNARFEYFARRRAIPGWELDVKAFKRYNRMRNQLLHRGDRNIRPHVSFENETRTLEDLVERYVSLFVFGEADVYKTRWRPERSLNGGQAS